MKKFDDYWWTCFPALPVSREDPRYPRIMRLYADHTLNGTRGDTGRSLYKHGGEDHLVLSFFENFTLDEKHDWVARIGTRIGGLRAPVLDAKWSYAFEEKLAGERRPRIADVVLHWRDEQGEAVIIVEAKKPGGVPRLGLNPKDDPRSGYYLKYTRMRNIPRKTQMLLVSEKDISKLDPSLRGDPRLVTWEDLTRLQFDILTKSVPRALRATFARLLLAHYSELGLVCEFGPQDTLQEKLDVPAQEKLDVPAAHISEQLATWLKGCECYLAVRRNGLSGDPPLSWLKNEPSRLALLGSKKQSTKDREMSLWQIAPGASP